MGLHTLTPQPTTGIGHKVEKWVHGLGAIKTMWDIGHLAWDAARFAAPYVGAAGGAALQAGRAAQPLITAAL